MRTKDIETMEDYYRLSYHITPPAGLLNDPNGFIEYKGRYHLFYQWNPDECAHGRKSWGHLSSSNLIQWEEHGPALKPVDTFDRNGCYSGSALETDGELILMYTGNVKYDDGGRDSYQCLARSTDGLNFEKLGPVIDGPPAGYTKHFRDPKVWKKGNLWHMVIGAQTEELDGRVLLYTSKDLHRWDFKSDIAGAMKNGIDKFGYMWECPDIFALDGRDVLIVSPQGVEASGDKYNNIYQSGYLVGDMDYEKADYTHGHFEELDRGFEFYAPQTTVDSQGRRLLFGWLGLPEEEEHPTVENGWIHAMTLPRELYLKEDKLCQRPVEELKELRKESVLYEDIRVDGELSLEGVEGDSYELILHIDEIEGDTAGIALRVGDGEETLFYIDKKEGKLILDRNRSGRGYKGVRKCLALREDGMKLHIFMDRSSLEIFVDGGEEVFTSRIYPSKESTGVRFISDKGYTIKKMEMYRI